MEDKRYPIELEVITPLSVGAGNDNEWVKGLDFVQKDGKVYVIDMQKVAAAGVDVGALTALFLKSDDRGISQLLGNKIGELSRYVFDLPAETDNNIKTLLRTQFYDKPVVVGSSIKGSIRSTLFNYLRTKEEKNEEVFGTMKDGTDFMRFIRIGDVEMPSTILVNTKLFNLRKEGEEWMGGWKHNTNKTTDKYDSVGFNTLYECVAPGNKGLGNITLAANAFSLLEKYGQGKSPYASQKRTLLNEPISHLFQIINDVTKGYLQKERAFFLKYDADRSGEVLNGIDSLLSMIPTDGSSCLLKMSAGVGFHSITGDWQYDDYDKTKIWTEGRHAGKKKYKSRKIAEYNHRLQLMGFVRLRALSPEVAADRTATLQLAHYTQQKQMLDVISQREAKRQQEIADELARQQAKVEQERRQKAFGQLMEQARTAYNDERWDEAIIHSSEALKYCPADNEALRLIDLCKKAQERVAFRLQEQELSKQKLGQPLADLISKIKQAGNLINKTKAWIEVETNSFGEAELTAFLSIVNRLPSREKKKLKGRLAELTPLLSKEQEEAICEELENL